MKIGIVIHGGCFILPFLFPPKQTRCWNVLFLLLVSPAMCYVLCYVCPGRTITEKLFTPKKPSLLIFSLFPRLNYIVITRLIIPCASLTLRCALLHVDH
jgi:hypothetical protein